MKDEHDVLADVLQVFGSDSGLHWPVLAGRLNARIPDRWTDTTGEAVSAECRARGVASVHAGVPAGRRPARPLRRRGRTCS